MPDRFILKKNETFNLNANKPPQAFGIYWGNRKFSEKIASLAKAFAALRTQNKEERGILGSETQGYVRMHV